MTGSSLLPATIHNGNILFLFGKECELEDSAKGFSDFGGGVDKGESIYITALREGAEESTGFLGEPNEINNHIHNHGGIYRINHNNEYYVHIFFIEYDANLPKYYNRNHHFLWNRMNRKLLNKTKLFEKIEIDWFSLQDIQTRRHEFRPFYAEITDRFIRENVKIKRFLYQCSQSIKKQFIPVKHVHFLTKVVSNSSSPPMIHNINRTPTPYPTIRTYKTNVSKPLSKKKEKYRKRKTQKKIKNKK